jgi:hypothetical protein
MAGFGSTGAHDPATAELLARVDGESVERRRYTTFD